MWAPTMPKLFMTRERLNMKDQINGIIPVMLTSFDDAGKIDWADMESLIEWYIAHGSNALFVVCQSSEMQFLSIEERVELARFTVKITNSRIPVVASGHIAQSRTDQISELNAMADTGIQALVLVTNRLDTSDTGTEAFRPNFDALLQALPTDMPLGFYECPSPDLRLLTDDEFQMTCDSGRFSVFKDVSCEMGQLMRRVDMAKGSPLAVVNANAAIAWPALQAGAPGFCGVANNYHPDLYRWLQDHGSHYPELAKELAAFLSLSALTEAYGYPTFAKIYLQRLGVIKNINSRVNNFDVRQRYKAIDSIVGSLIDGTEIFRTKVLELP